MKLKEYLLSQLSQTFFPIFLGLYFITSIIFLVKIASLSSAITINFVELLKLYSYVMPTIIFFTLPISFFISLVITLSKLSSEYELIVITSFGLNPLNIIKIFFPVTILMTIALIIISVGLIPKAKYLNKAFIEQKKKEANFNIKASEFGQKFGDWLIYIEDKDDKKYSKVKLFKTKDNKDQFIISDNAVLENENGNLSFKFINGKSFVIDDEELNQIDYKNMYLNDSIVDSNIEDFTTSFNYWKANFLMNQNTDRFSFNILVSIFPLISLLLVVYAGYFNPRYEKNKSVMKAVIFVTAYYIFMQVSVDNLLLHSLYVVPLSWIIFTYFMYHRSVKQQY